jgi:carbon starvation protein CstA
MKKLFNYCFYRIALFYKRHIPLEDYHGQGVFLQIFAILLYILTLLEIVLRLYGLKLTKEIAFIFLVPFVILTIMINRIFPQKEELFNELCLKYQHEKHKWIKGLCVCLYIIMSLVCFLCVFLVFKSPF